MIANAKYGAALLAILAGLSQADTITVGPGLIYDFTSIQAAIDAAEEGDTVLVAKGRYREKIVFPGKNILVTSTDPNDPGVVQQTVINCPSSRQTPVVTFSGKENESCELTGFGITEGRGGVQGNGTKATISNCAIGKNFARGSGGGLYDCDGPIRSCKIIGNEADSKGGGLYDCDGPISNCTVSENSVRGSSITDGGGGLYGCDGPITNCTISENWSGSDAGSGGGLHSCHGAITGCTIRGNGARGHGGGLSNCNGSISECTITGNSARDPAFQSRGGGLYDCDGTISGCTITGNEADEAGGGLYGCDGLIDKCKILNNASAGWNGGGLAECQTILNCVISDNSAAGSGGALERCHSITSCLVSGNVAGRDGGALHECAEALNCTMTGNKAGRNGGAIYYSGTESIVGNSILWDNKAAEGAQIYLDAPVNAGTGDGSGWMSIAYSDVQGGTAEVYVAAGSILDWDLSNIEADPGFVQPGHWTADGAWIDGDYHLIQGSPCINAGYPDSLPQLGEADLDGNPRVIRGIVDMGVYESRYAVNLHVDAVNGNDSYDGLTPETAFATIQKGIAAAEDGDTVIVHPSTYFENVRFNGKSITVGSTNPNDPNAVAATIIDGGQNGSVVTFNSGEDATCVLTGFTITNGRSDQGGGITVSGASPTISHCTLTGNSAVQLGGGVYSVSGSPTLTYCTFSENSAGMGGGMHNHFDSHPTLTHCNFNSNSAGSGAGMSNYAGSTLMLTHCNFNSNSAEYGAGIGNFAGSKLILRQCTLTANSAQYGGALFSEPSRITLTNCELSHNSAIQGGAIHAQVSIVEIANSCLTKNSATVGAGIYSLDGRVTTTNSLLSENAATEQGGAIFLYGGPNAGIVANNCTFVRNTAAEGRAIACHGELGDTLATVTVTNSILWDGGDEIWFDGNFTTIVTYSDVQDGWPGEGNISDNPQFAPDGYHLLLNSPCINAGDPAGDYSEQTDIDGQYRVISGRIDIGADEFLDEGPTFYYINALTGSDLNDGLSSQTAFATIQKGVNSANHADTVAVYPGTYSENIVFEGKNITLTSTDPNDPNVVAATVIDGGRNGPAVTFNNGESAGCILTGFTITDGHNDCGGGIFASNASPAVTNCVFTGNTADLGGAIYCSDNSDLSLQNCTIDRNSAGFGGAMYCLLSRPKMSNCMFSMNQGTWAGGAVFNDKAAPTFSNCIFNDNSTNGDGGGMLNEASSPKLSNCDVSGNSARTGGGIYYGPGCEPTIIGGKIAQNYADYGGGIYVTECISAKVTNCFIIQNMAILGAGIYSADTVLTIKQCVFCENMARYGAAVFCDAQLDGRAIMNNCTLAGNAAVLGRSIACDSFLGSSAVTVTNSILYNGGSEILNNDNSKILITYSDIQGGWPGKNNIDADPRFTDISRGVYDLLPDSPCIDAGDPQYLPEPNETDFSGRPRLVGEAVDMGAYETQPAMELTVEWFEFNATIGFANPDEQILIIRNSGAGTVNWQISYDCNWLQVHPASGSSKGEGNTAWLRVNTAGLSAGQYNCKLTVSAPGAINDPQIVQVELLVHKNCFPEGPEYARQYADFLEYAAVGADPSCWCASPSDGSHYQCDGDASGRTQAFTNYRVFTDDLALIIKNWKGKVDTADPCADIDHKAQLFQRHRVFTNDLAMLITNWKKRDDQLPNDCPRPDGYRQL